MDGIHDLGGQQGYGPVAVTTDYVAFDAEWEGRMFGISQSYGAPDWNIDWFRHLVELLPPGVYLTIPYFEKWCLGSMAGAVNSGLWSAQDVIAATGDMPVGRAAVKSVDDVVAAVQAKCTDFSRPMTGQPKFAIGDAVTTARHGAPGHTRLPAYARGRRGRVQALHGAHLLPDAVVFGDEVAEPLYTVRFAAQDLWGAQAEAGDDVMIDLWESYLVSS